LCIRKNHGKQEDKEIIVCKIELFKNPIIDLINQEISAERERSIT
jgi:hypothetical protein